MVLQYINMNDHAKCHINSSQLPIISNAGILTNFKNDALVFFSSPDGAAVENKEILISELTIEPLIDNAL